MNRSKRKNRFLTYVLIAVFLLVLFLFYFYNFNKTQNISDIKSEENIGKTVTINGEIKHVFKIGELSGYFLEDESDSIRVSSEDLPVEGEDKKVRGILMKDSIFGYYLKVD